MQSAGNGMAKFDHQESGDKDVPQNSEADMTHTIFEGAETSDISLYRAIASVIAERLDAGDIPDGVRLSETMVAKLFKVSRTPARQALEWLASEKLISRLSTRGFATGSTPWATKGRLSDYADLISEAGDTDLLATEASLLLDDVEGVVTRLSVLGSWRLSVRALQQRYSASKKSIEDTLKRLEFNGLLTHRKGGQWIIYQLDEARLEGLYDIRSWLEPNLLQQATVYIPMEILDKTLAAHECALEKLPDVTGAELDNLELCLHRNLLEYAGNPAGIAALKTVNAGLILSKHILATYEIPVGEEDPFIEEHIAVLGALKRRRSEESKLRLLAHLLKSREKVSNRLKVFRSIAITDKVDFATKIDL